MKSNRSKVPTKAQQSPSHKSLIARDGKDTYNTSIPPSLSQKVRVTTEPLSRYYTKGVELGLGAFANVFLGTHQPTQAQYAIKKIDRQKMMWGEHDALEDEINSLILVREGPNIVQLYEVYEEPKNCFLVMELMRGGELFDRILEKKIFTEKEARDCTRCILNGLDFMHQRRVVHRDLKPENLLLPTADSDTHVKLADFGFAKKVLAHNGLRTLCGTPGYLAPEILERWPAYDTPCDLWSVGVILFLLLGGYLPFEDDDEDKVFERTRNGVYDFHPTYWKGISAEAKDLVTHLLTVNTRKRVDTQNALAHGWMTGKVGETKLNIHKLKENVMAQKQEKKNSNRMQDLKETFDGFLERNKSSNQRRMETTDSHPARRPQHKRFEEDSKTGKPFAEFYDLGDLLGEGGYARVYRATHKRTKEVYAVKDIE